MKMTIVKDRVPEVMDQIRALTKKEALVGIPDANAGRMPEEGEDKAPISNAEIGYIMETGSPSRNIPARPHLVPGIENAKDRIANALKAGAKGALSGDNQAVDQALNKAGIIGQSAVQSKITEGPFAPLSPVTIAARERRGRTGIKPLIDTGQYRRAITYVVRPKGK